MKSLIDRIINWRRPQPQTQPSTAVESDALDDLREYIRRDVASGFYDEEVILQHACDAFDAEFDPADLRRSAQRLLRETLKAQRASQQGWPARTDCDRLDAAFAALEADGVIARQNFTCCGTCGNAEIWEEIEVADAAGQPTRGYAFFHMQDTESAVDGHGLYLGYGACEDGEAAALAVGRDIVAQIEAHGLRVRWNGSWNTRIAVTLDWKRRR